MNIYLFFEQKKNFQIIFLLFFVFYMLKLGERIRGMEMFDNLSISTVQIWVLRYGSFWLIFFPWIRMKSTVYGKLNESSQVSTPFIGKTWLLKITHKKIVTQF